MPEDFDPQKLAGILIPAQSTLDEAMATGNIARVSPVSLARLTDWNGLTPAQEHEKEDQLLSERRRQEILAEIEYEQTMQEVREQANRLTVQLDEQRRVTLHKLADADARAIVLPDGRHVLVGGQSGEFIDQNTGQTLQGADKDAAQKLERPDSETAAERKGLTDRLQQIDEAEEHVRKAEAIADQDDKNLSPEQKKQNEIAAQKELAAASATANAETQLSGPNGPPSTLYDTDTLSALGLDTTSTIRNTSYAATLDEKDKIATNLLDQFTDAGQQQTGPAQPGTSAGLSPSKPQNPIPTNN